VKKHLFKRQAVTFSRLAVLVLLSLLVMIADHRFHAADGVRAATSLLVTPLRYAVNLPLNTANWLLSSVKTERKLLKINAELRANQLHLQSQLQQFIALEKENSQLRHLLNFAKRSEYQVKVAEIVAVNSEPYVEQIVINQGKRDQVALGQPIFDAFGVMGQVIELGLLSSRVLLITDPKSAVPVQVARTGARGIVVGDGAMRLHLLNMPITADIKPGDKLITSGLGQRYPIGYPVGVVSSITNQPGAQFSEVEVIPAAHINKSRLVLVLWLNQAIKEVH